MRLRIPTLLLLSASAVAAVASCIGEDAERTTREPVPEAGADAAMLPASDAQAQPSGDATPAGDARADADATADASPPGPGNSVFVSELFPAVEASCAGNAGCHIAGGTGGQFFGGLGDAEAAYGFFRARAFDANGAFLTKGMHTGPALTPQQQQLVQRWMNAEQDAGPSD